VSTVISRGSRTSAAHEAIASDNSRPTGKPTNTFIREVTTSLRVQRSSTPPEE
jgi:hypothetical protein